MFSCAVKKALEAADKADAEAAAEAPQDEAAGAAGGNGSEEEGEGGGEDDPMDVQPGAIVAAA